MEAMHTIIGNGRVNGVIERIVVAKYDGHRSEKKSGKCHKTFI